MNGYINKVILILVMLLVSQNAFSFNPSQPDKQKHIAVSTIISSTIKSYSGSTSYSFGTCMAIGTAKEVYDDMQPNNRFDEEDMLANLIGCGIGIPIGTLGNNLFFNGRQIGWRFRF